MIMATAKVIEDSIYKDVRLVTIQLRYPRFIHSELMTHRVFSRNASSSRAVPAKKIWAQICEAPAMPVEWGLNEPGMQATKTADTELAAKMEDCWRRAAQSAVAFAQEMDGLGAHKQIVNRITEPFSFIQVVVTSTEWDNFWELRDHPDADPTFQQLAKVMKDEIDNSKPNQLGHGRYHLPYILAEESQEFSVEDLVKFSVARCARVSYLLHDGTTPNRDKDLELFDRLVGGKPLHASPLEHQARPAEYFQENLNGNLRDGWCQFRKCFERGEQQVFWEGAK